MKHYEVGSVQFDGKTYFLVRRTEDASICLLPTKYLKHKTKANCSPNTVERSARALSYFMEYMRERLRLSIQQADGTIPAVFILDQERKTSGDAFRKNMLKCNL